MKELTVCYINQFDEPNWERAKLQIGRWMQTSERGQFLRQHFKGLRWNIEPDGGMEPHYIVEVECSLEDKIATYYNLRWPSAIMVDNSGTEKVL
jgi:hypothetical protein